MKFSTQAKLAVASIRALSASEIKDVISSQFHKSKEETNGIGKEVANTMGTIFKVYEHGFDGCINAVNTCSDEDVDKAQAATTQLIENTAKFIEENVEAITLLGDLAKKWFSSAVDETRTAIKADESIKL